MAIFTLYSYPLHNELNATEIHKGISHISYENRGLVFVHFFVREYVENAQIIGYSNHFEW